MSSLNVKESIVIVLLQPGSPLLDWNRASTWFLILYPFDNGFEYTIVHPDVLDGIF